jgi:hypothetical protein
MNTGNLGQSMVKERYCARCLQNLWRSEGRDSDLYSPSRTFLLCERCFLMESDEIGKKGTRDIPERLRQYKSNQPHVMRIRRRGV